MHFWPHTFSCYSLAVIPRQLKLSHSSLSLPPQSRRPQRIVSLSIQHHVEKKIWQSFCLQKWTHTMYGNSCLQCHNIYEKLDKRGRFDQSNAKLFSLSILNRDWPAVLKGTPKKLIHLIHSLGVSLRSFIPRRMAINRYKKNDGTKGELIHVQLMGKEWPVTQYFDPCPITTMDRNEGCWNLSPHRPIMTRNWPTDWKDNQLVFSLCTVPQ